MAISTLLPTKEYVKGLVAHDKLNEYERTVLIKIYEKPGRFIDAYIRGISNQYKAKLALKHLVELNIVLCRDFRFYPYEVAKI